MTISKTRCGLAGYREKTWQISWPCHAPTCAPCTPAAPPAPRPPAPRLQYHPNNSNFLPWAPSAKMTRAHPSAQARCVTSIMTGTTTATKITSAYSLPGRALACEGACRHWQGAPSVHAPCPASHPPVSHTPHRNPARTADKVHTALRRITLAVTITLPVVVTLVVVTRVLFRGCRAQGARWRLRVVRLGVSQRGQGGGGRTVRPGHRARVGAVGHVGGLCATDPRVQCWNAALAASARRCAIVTV